jgi:lysine-ketoglutarate reductase/saccharopine dehydrogenase-like protein (TIGR00300 family)
MGFKLPVFEPPDFNAVSLRDALPATFCNVENAGVAPDNYHATSIFPEYFKVGEDWHLAHGSRMDCVVVLRDDGALLVTEARHLKPGDRVACGRRENGEDGIYVHTTPFVDAGAFASEKFAFRTGISRETSFSIDYDELFELLDFERDNGFILWVLGPAVAFDKDAREAFAELIEQGYVHGMLAGNALAAHDIEGALYGTALGQEIYSKKHTPLGHYNHLDAINRVRGVGSIHKAMELGDIREGIMHAIVRNNIPYVLAGSIRDDGPLPEVIADVYHAQDRMRDLTRRATTVIAMATQLHAIATGNMTPSYTVTKDNIVRPVYFYSIDMSEFAANKLADRGSLTAHSILTNVQDFVVILRRGIMRRARER